MIILDLNFSRLYDVLYLVTGTFIMLFCTRSLH